MFILYWFRNGVEVFLFLLSVCGLPLHRWFLSALLVRTSFPSPPPIQRVVSPLPSVVAPENLTTAAFDA